MTGPANRMVTTGQQDHRSQNDKHDDVQVSGREGDAARLAAKG